MKRGRMVVAMVSFLMAFWVLAAWAESPPPLLHFAILSDRTGGHIEGVYPRVIEEIARLNPDFVVTVGDHIEGYGEDMNLASAQWDTILGMIGRLGAPVYMTPGNHDIWSDPSRLLYVEKTGRDPYYSFDRAGVHFVILDNSRFDSWADLPDDQREWLVADLESHREASRTFVFAHKPLWVSTLAMGQPDSLHPILKKYGVDAFFGGHLHHFFSAEYDGIRYVTIGSSGGSMYRADSEPVERGEFFQFGWVTVTGSDHELAIVHLGNVYGHDVSTIENELEIGRIESEYVTTLPVRVGEE
jgi:predicted phosphodiesterase